MKNKAALKTIALIPPGLAAGILTLFALGETAGGDWSGLGHLVFAAPIVLLIWLAWVRPAWGGALILLLGLGASIFYLDALRGPGWLAPFLIIIAPLLFSGLLLLVVARMEKVVS